MQPGDIAIVDAGDGPRHHITTAVAQGTGIIFEPGEEHWHGATPNRFMTHLALLEVDDEDNSATWGEHVTDEEYGLPSR